VVFSGYSTNTTDSHDMTKIVLKVALLDSMTIFESDANQIEVQS